MAPAARIARATATAAVAALAVIAVAALAGLAVLPALGLCNTLTVLSGSMEPTFRPGDLVVVTPEPLSEVREGQVIAYSVPVADHQVVTHRVIELVHGGDAPVIRTRGDANPAADPWTAKLHGTTAWRMRFVIPHAGTVVRFVRGPAVHAALVLVAPIMLGLIWLYEIGRPDRDPAPRRAAGAA
jgi:signal peptidase I